MEKRRRWSVIRQHFFILVTLLGCLVPWVTPRLFQTPGTTAPLQPEIAPETVATLPVQQAGRLGDVCVIQPDTSPDTPQNTSRWIAGQRQETKQKK